MTPVSRSLVIVGAGPRCIGLLDSLGVSLGGGGNERPKNSIVIHVVDPHPAGAGRIWRRDQPALLLMNSRADETTVFSSASVADHATGPTLAQWSREHAESLPDDLAREARRLGPGDFATRRLGGEYLRWSFLRVARLIRPWAYVRVHETSAETVDIAAVGDADPGRHRVRLASGVTLAADAVVLAMGNRDGAPPIRDVGMPADGPSRRRETPRIAPRYTADLDLHEIRPAQRIEVVGLGLAFADLFARLTIERGGTFAAAEHGLVYQPSGREPVLSVTSPGGTPYLPKPDRPALRLGTPRIATTPALIGALAGIDDLKTDSGPLWNLVFAEMAAAWYADIEARHPGVLLDGSHDVDHLLDIDWRGGEEWRAAVSDPLARFAPARRLVTTSNLGMTPTAICQYLRQMLTRATGPFGHAQGAVYEVMVDIAHRLGEGYLDGTVQPGPRSLAAVLELMSYARWMTSGPPPVRIAQLVALIECGIVEVCDPRTPSLGADLRIDARVPAPDVRSGPDHLLERLVASGRVGHSGQWDGASTVRLSNDPTVFAALGPDGKAVPGCYAIGSFASSGALGAFPQPGRPSRFARENRAVARDLLTLLAVEGVGGPGSLGIASKRPECEQTRSPITAVA